jgi:valyl-tRNA synthetase
VVDEATGALDRYDHTAALTAAEGFFWRYCDDYIELVKERGYRDGGRSARAALRAALDAQLRLLAPVLPFVTEEVWSWWRPGSVHRSPWPTAAELGVDPSESGLLSLAGNVLGQVRRAKSQRHLSMKAEVARAEVHADPQVLARLAQAYGDLCAAAHIGKLDEVPDDSLDPTVVCHFD